MATTWVLDVRLAGGDSYRVLGPEPIRTDADLDELKSWALSFGRDGVVLRPAGFAGSAATSFVVLQATAITSIALRVHEEAPDPLAMLWAVDTSGS